MYWQSVCQFVSIDIKHIQNFKILFGFFEYSNVHKFEILRKIRKHMEKFHVNLFVCKLSRITKGVTNRLSGRYVYTEV